MHFLEPCLRSAVGACPRVLLEVFTGAVLRVLLDVTSGAFPRVLLEAFKWVRSQSLA